MSSMTIAWMRDDGGGQGRDGGSGTKVMLIGCSFLGTEGVPRSASRHRRWRGTDAQDGGFGEEPVGGEQNCPLPPHGDGSGGIECAAE